MGIALFLAAALAALPLTAADEPTVAERLGYRATDRLVIINGDDTGMCHSANVATFDSMANGLMTSATIMVPCPWFLEAARYAKANPKLDFGVHLTHTSEWQVYRWGPVTDSKLVPGLIDAQGYLWRAEVDVFKNAPVEQAVTEARAQIKRALDAGIDVTHLDSHMGGMQYDPKFHAAYIQLGREFDLPVRMASQATYAMMGFTQIRADARKEGIVFPDYLIHGEPAKGGETRKEYWMRILREAKPGITELYIHAGLPNEELQAIAGSWKERGIDYELFTKDPDVRKLIEDQKIIRIGYRPLRELQRKERKARG